MSVQKINKTDGSLTLLAGSTLWASNPIGTILAYGGSSAPSGWFLCQGQAISRTTYSELFAVIGTSFGSGDGSTTFNLPDLREATTKGVGLTGKSNNHYDADGLALGEFIEDRLQNHTHSTGTMLVAKASTSPWYATNSYEDSPSAVANLKSGNVQSARYGATTEVKAVGVNYIIKAKMVAMPSDFMSKVDEAVESYVKHVTKNGRTGLSGATASKWEIIEFSDNFALCIGVNTSTVTVSALTAVNLALPDGYTGVQIISGNAFASGNTGWVTATSHMFTTNVGGTVYVQAGTYGTGQIREILIATKS